MQEVSKLRAAVYARVSTEEQRLGKTIDSQVKALETFAQQGGLQIHKQYCDDGWTSESLARPALDRLRDDAAKGLFDVVLINDIDRMAREVFHYKIIEHDLKRHGVEIKSPKLPEMDNDPINNFIRNILGSVAELEREMIRDRTRRGRRFKAEDRNQYVGCVAAYGYRYIKGQKKGDGRLEINHEEAAIVGRMFEWVANEKLSVSKVARRLNALGVPTRKTRAAGWQPSTVITILRKEMYIGRWYYCRREAVEPKTPRNLSPYRKPRSSRRFKPKSQWVQVLLPKELQIIESSLWEAAQRQIDSNPRFAERNAKLEYLLQGLLKCDLCGATVYGRYSGSKANGYVYYLCSKQCPQSRWRRRAELENAVWEAIRGALSDPQRLEEIILRASDEALNRKGQSVQRYAELTRRDIEAKEVALMRGLQQGQISHEVFTSELQRFRVMREELSDPGLISDKVDKKTVHRTVVESCEKMRDKLSTNEFATRVQIVRRFVSGVFLNSGSIRIEAKLTTSNTAMGACAIASTNLSSYEGKCAELKCQIIVPLSKTKTSPKAKSTRAEETKRAA